jgi:LemA protein
MPMFNGHLGTSQSKKPGEIHRLPVLTGHVIYQRLIGKSTGILILLLLFCFAIPVMNHFSSHPACKEVRVFGRKSATITRILPNASYHLIFKTIWSIFSCPSKLRRLCMIIFYAFLIVVILLIGWVVAKYNSLITLRNQVTNGWKQIDVQLKRRHDLIPNLVSSVKGQMQFEQETLEKVIQARNSAISAKGVADSAVKEDVLSSALTKLFALVENYPTLKSNENVKQLQEELTSTENKISFARQFYNDIATKFNTAQQVFPANLIASAFNFKAAELFEIQAAAEREVPAVDLSLKK